MEENMGGSNIHLYFILLAVEKGNDGTKSEENSYFINV
jgi:hypothetical protein